MHLKSKVVLFLVAAILAGGIAADAAEHTIYVGPKDSEAYENAKGLAEAPDAHAQRTLHKAVRQAAQLLNQPGPQTVRLLVASGAFDGKAGAGFWEFPAFRNPEGALHILGGCADDFQSRNPFGAPTRLVTSAGRGAAFFQFTRMSAVRELVISGFLMDCAPSNRYAGEGGGLHKSGSRSYPLISFAQIATDHVVVADNVFMNAANGVFETFIKSMSDKTVFDIENNLFLNNVLALKVGSGTTISGLAVSQINVRRNTFLLNWPYNPGDASSNVSAVTLNDNGAVRSVLFEGNIFAHNPGGAMQHDWPEDRMPKLAMKKNLFFDNARLFKKTEDDAGVFVGKFGANPRYLILGIEDIEDDFDYELEGNVSIDPGFAVENGLVVTGPEDGEDEFDQDVMVEGYAPAMKYDPASPPVPSTEKARGYGVQIGQVWSR